MDSPQKDSDRYLVVALFILGIVAIAGTYFSARVVADRMIQKQAIETGEHWAQIVVDTIATAGPGNWTVVSMALVRELRTGASFGHINGVTVYGPDGTKLAETQGEAGLGLRAGIEADAADHGAIEDAVAGTVTLRERETADGEETRLHADVYVPVALDGLGTGAVQVAVDHTGPARLFTSGFEKVTGAAAFVLWIAFMVPTFIAWRRVEDRRKAHDAIQYLAHHDTLTALPNRAQFNRALEDALGRAERHGKKVAVLCLDLDRFKDVNDTLGHPIGDGLLRTVAVRLGEAVREIDVIGRLGGDEFAVVAEDIQGAEDTIPLAQRLCEALAEPIQIEGHDIATSTSIGIAIAPDDGGTAELILKNADLALYRAKNDGRNTFRFFEREMDVALQKRRRLEHDMRQALQREQFELHYQPQYDLKTASLSGYEALLRWNHPESGAIAPDVFIPVAEETGLIVQIGAWALEQACRDAAKWDESLRVAVNLSPAQFRNHDIVATVEGVLARSGLDPKRLELEITEGLLMRDTAATLDVLNRLRNLGISIAMDDFGT
ncbi:MAG: diguanylate cyclase, partial [Hyphomicrobiales bacterium]|nr:diguanylate cyclase [Hyphomicrobiales bacterium]